MPTGEQCKVCSRPLVNEWARATVRGETERAAHMERLMQRGYCDAPECEAIELGNSGRMKDE